MSSLLFFFFVIVLVNVLHYDIFLLRENFFYLTKWKEAASFKFVTTIQGTEIVVLC